MTEKDYLVPLENENEEQYIWRVGNLVDAGLVGGWRDITPSINKYWREDETHYRDESAYRKLYQYAKKMYNNVFLKEESNNECLQEMKKAQRELEAKKVQYRDERQAWNKQNYLAARVEQKLDLLEKELNEIGRNKFVVSEYSVPIMENGSNDLVIALSDLHIGATYDSYFGKYNSDIAEKRLQEYLNRIIEIKNVHKSENCYVVLAGDLISGNIHKSIAITNRENVIEQIKIASELISNFCYTLSKHFHTVYFADAVGNHTRIDKKDDALHSERLDSLISFIVSNCMSHIDNFKLCEKKYDIGIASMDVRGKEFICVHGDFDNILNSSAISQLSMMIGHLPYCILSGHKHTPAFLEYWGVKVVQSGSLGGSGDDYTIERRLRGDPSQTVLVCDDEGIKSIYNITLK